MLLAQGETGHGLWVVVEWWGGACCGAVARHGVLCSTVARFWGFGLHMPVVCWHAVAWGAIASCPLRPGAVPNSSGNHSRARVAVQ